MIVTDGDFNNASIRRVLDTKYPSAMKKPNPTDFVLKDKAKFDVQNPVIGSLFEQIRKNKKNEFARKLLKLPTTDAQKETKSTFEKIADFSRKIRKDDVLMMMMLLMMLKIVLLPKVVLKKNLGDFLLILMRNKKILKKLCQNLFLLLELLEMKK